MPLDPIFICERPKCGKEWLWMLLGSDQYDRRWTLRLCDEHAEYYRNRVEEHQQEGVFVSFVHRDDFLCEAIPPSGVAPLSAEERAFFHGLVKATLEKD